MEKTDKLYKGVIVPMITPVNENFLVDQEAVEKILVSFLNVGVSPFVLGTTGESTSLSGKQKMTLVANVTAFVNKRRKVYAGISGNCLKESVDQAEMYFDIGVDAVVAHPPYYYPISQHQMMSYFESLADQVPCPLILYNNPITTRNSISLEIADRLSYHENVAGLKDSERDPERLDRCIELWKNRKDFSYLVGWAAQSAYALKKGADGIVPSTGNLTPELYRDLYDISLQGKWLEADALQQITNKVSEVYQKNRDLGQSIPALKALMAVYDLCKPYVMPPMYRLSSGEEGQLENTIKELLKNKTYEVK